MTDIVPALWARIESDFNKRIEHDEKIQQFLSKMEKGTAVSEDTAMYAMYIGEHAGAVLKAHLDEKNLPDGKLYWNIADRTIRPMAELVYQLVNDAAVKVMESEYRAQGIGLRAQKAQFPEERLRDLIDKVVNVAAGEEDDGK